MAYKRPESVLVVIYAFSSRRVLMLQRRDDPDFWQSVTGSLDGDETPWETALREVQEEVGIDIIGENLELIDCRRSLYYEIFTHLRHRYAPGVTRNKEYWFCLALPEERECLLTEHQAYQWLDADKAVKLTKSWSNRQAIEEFVIE
ncbi:MULTISPECIES: dihydroneopterin triphosphate diphosphatase [Photorhabdus]|uniref:Dihydroneopterin triphosphate diphosphatase n=2 Tax=Photorhabdus TaxID=29487 RepID=A0A329X293_9GAMM|nr:MULTISPECIES: dihydroneopterin triphosphate diphosphatase [Photorhabdus]PQQ39301.1 dihydroneopterin triphosphate diphosphatase [Photorhabdus luminescens]MCC8374384.1 dihydroneopterin triphosphate diphosphatase [Photorhabdus bodei]MCC8463403.1 dihydroneopterin triphosphate diphosphatase [Photorhabdus bodei]MCT8341841.1 dihydroneopterin triphosphate diphosphatase [Photorhabdus kleinii]MCT8350914.1 dihydroneopterin triphosphate diphosphatase [Photorhabdus kayaii]